QGAPLTVASDEPVLSVLRQRLRRFLGLGRRALEDRAVELGRALDRRDAELAIEGPDALAVLRDGGISFTRLRIEADQAPVRRLVDRVEREPAAGVLDRGRPLAAGRALVGGLVENRRELPGERSRGERLPAVECGAVAKAEAGEK